LICFTQRTNVVNMHIDESHSRHDNLAFSLGLVFVFLAVVLMLGKGQEHLLQCGLAYGLVAELELDASLLQARKQLGKRK
jgi:hypothetical protein